MVKKKNKEKIRSVIVYYDDRERFIGYDLVDYKQNNDGKSDIYDECPLYLGDGSISLRVNYVDNADYSDITITKKMYNLKSYTLLPKMKIKKEYQIQNFKYFYNEDDYLTKYIVYEKEIISKDKYDSIDNDWNNKYGHDVKLFENYGSI